MAPATGITHKGLACLEWKQGDHTSQSSPAQFWFTPVSPEIISSIPFTLRLPLWLSWYRMHLQCRKPGFDPWVGKIPWRREWLPTLVFWPGEFHGLYSPWGGKESDTTEQLSLHLHSQRCPSFPFCGHRRGRHLLETIPWTEEPGISRLCHCLTCPLSKYFI